MVTILRPAIIIFLTRWNFNSKIKILPITRIDLRPDNTYPSISMKESTCFAFDVGGTKIAGAVFDASGQIVHRETLLIEQRQGAEVAALIGQLIDQFTTFIESRSWGLQGVGVAVPGIVYRKTRTVWAPNIKGWEQFPLEEILRNYLPAQVPVIIDNDRACYILGEKWQGAAQGSSHAIYLGVGTGIGAGILIDNVVLRGQNDIAGAIGWMALTDQYLSQYGEHGCFEHHASGGGIAGMAAQAFAKSGRPSDAVSTAAVFELYHQQDPVAQQILDRAILFWGMAVANLVSLFNPETIIFGGGVFGPGLEFLEDIYQEATRWAQPISIKQVKLVKSGLEEQAGLYGAGYLVKDLIDQS